MKFKLKLLFDLIFRFKIKRFRIKENDILIFKIPLSKINSITHARLAESLHRRFDNKIIILDSKFSLSSVSKEDAIKILKRVIVE